LIGTTVPSVKFSLTEPKENVKYVLNPLIKLEIKQTPSNVFAKLLVSIVNAEDKPTPFEVELAVTGTFVLSGKVDVESVRLYVSNTLYPFARTAVADITLKAGIPPYYLPFINFGEAKKKEDEIKDGE
jgi:preprotein translocase subunit SecB